MSENLLEAAQAGDIQAFEALFQPFYPQLKSYLYRLTADRNDAEDFTHDTFVKGFDRIGQFKGNASLKTWIFRLATNLAYDELKRRNRWSVDIPEQAKEIVMEGGQPYQAIVQVANRPSVESRFAIKDHIDTCFTCVGKTLPIEQQVVLLLKDVYRFSIREIGEILSLTDGVVKYQLQSARKTMIQIFEERCALVNKNGVCHQCSELNGWLNPKQDRQVAINAIEMTRAAEHENQETLYEMRLHLIQGIDPLRSGGYALQEALMRCNRLAAGEIDAV